jgi:hypothetical protein
VNPTARRAACGNTAVKMTADEKVQNQNRALILPAFSARKSRPETAPLKTRHPCRMTLFGKAQEI